MDGIKWVGRRSHVKYLNIHESDGYRTKYRRTRIKVPKASTFCHTPPLPQKVLPVSHGRSMAFSVQSIFLCIEAIIMPYCNLSLSGTSDTETWSVIFSFMNPGCFSLLLPSANWIFYPNAATQKRISTSARYTQETSTQHYIGIGIPSLSFNDGRAMSANSSYHAFRGSANVLVPMLYFCLKFWDFSF